MKGLHHFFQVFAVCNRIPAVVAGQLTGGIGYQRDLFRFYFQYQIYEFLFTTIAFYVEFGVNERTQGPNIGITDMSLIGTWMHSNTVGPERLRIECHLQQVRIISTPGITQGGEFVDIDGEFGHEAKLRT